MRLGDLDALFEEFERAAWYNNMDRDEIAEEILLQMPTIDAVPVVRCRECKHWTSVDGRIEHMECNVFCGCYGRGYPTNADDFCSYGERDEVAESAEVRCEHEAENGLCRLFSTIEVAVPCKGDADCEGFIERGEDE